MTTLFGTIGDAMVSYRLSRQRAVDEFLAGQTLPHEVCDAQPELRRVAHHHGIEVNELCPICEGQSLVHVLFAFGTGLPKSGRCVTDRGELTRLRRRGKPSQCYRIEVCRQCWWNHVLESYAIKGTESITT